VLVQVQCSTICGKQVGEILGHCGEDKYLPHLLGHEGCGKVLKFGPGVTKVKEGDQVVMHWRKGAGIEAKPPKYKWKDRTVGAGPVATFADHAVVSENRLTPTGVDVQPWVGSLMGCAVTTALGLINNEAQLKIGQSIAIAGAGGVGLNIVQGAAMVSACPIIAIDKVTNRLRVAGTLGATHMIDSRMAGNDLAAAIRQIVGKSGVDVFVDCTGSPRVISDGLEATASGGRLILVGQPPVNSDLVISDFRRHYCGKTILDSQGGLTNPTIDIPRYLELYRQGKLVLNILISESFPLADINKAIAAARNGSSGRIALEM